MDTRLAFAEEGITWTRERLFNQIFSDEVWAMRGAYTMQYVSCKKDSSDRYSAENVTQKYSKIPAQMFHGCIAQSRKVPAVFWEKDLGGTIIMATFS